ncbi:MAG: hypothetical protein IH631_04575, partial [Candidatus Thorarchaeota archaeon]|nr:hypothetical protein [Candidatus Thorarchaeota archaeon]
MVPSGYCEEWWSHDLEHAILNLSTTQLTNRLKGSGLTHQSLNTIIVSPLTILPTSTQAVHLSKKLKIPLHPYYLYRWRVLTTDEIKKLRKWILTNHSISKKYDGKIVLPFVQIYKTMLERVGIPHRFSVDCKKLVLSDDPFAFLAQLGPDTKSPKGKDTLSMLNSVSDVILQDKVGFSIGARMGRPEKAEERRMKPPVQSLFPVGRSRGSERRIDEVANNVRYISTLDSFDENTDTKYLDTSGVKVELVARKCPDCEIKTFESKCHQCG